MQEGATLSTEETNTTPDGEESSEHESEGVLGEEELTSEFEGRPPTMLERWARDDAIPGAFTIIKKDGTRIKI